MVGIFLYINNNKYTKLYSMGTQFISNILFCRLAGALNQVRTSGLDISLILLATMDGLAGIVVFFCMVAPRSFRR